MYPDEGQDRAQDQYQGIRTGTDGREGYHLPRARVIAPGVRSKGGGRNPPYGASVGGILG